MLREKSTWKLTCGADFKSAACPFLVRICCGSQNPWQIHNFLPRILNTLNFYSFLLSLNPQEQICTICCCGFTCGNWGFSAEDNPQHFCPVCRAPKGMCTRLIWNANSTSIWFHVPLIWMENPQCRLHSKQRRGFQIRDMGKKVICNFFAANFMRRSRHGLAPLN